MKNVYAVITIDVVKSKKSIDSIANYLKENDIHVYGDDEDLVIRFLRYKCADLNSELWNKDFVITDLRPLAGDSAQVVCKNIVCIPEILRMIRFNLRPLKLRIGIGLGTVGSCFIEERDSWNRSGSAFYNARQAIDMISKKSNKYTYFIVDKKNIAKYRYIQESINTIFMLVDDVEAKWSDTKWASVQAYDELGTYEKASGFLGISSQAINKNCKAAKFDIIKESEITLKSLFKQVSIEEDIFSNMF